MPALRDETIFERLKVSPELADPQPWFTWSRVGWNFYREIEGAELCFLH